MSFTIKCDKCGKEQKFKEDDSWYGEDVELRPACWGGSLALDIECKNPECEASISFEIA